MTSLSSRAPILADTSLDDFISTIFSVCFTEYSSAFDAHQRLTEEARRDAALEMCSPPAPQRLHPWLVCASRATHLILHVHHFTEILRLGIVYLKLHHDNCSCDRTDKLSVQRLTFTAYENGLSTPRAANSTVENYSRSHSYNSSNRPTSSSQYYSSGSSAASWGRQSSRALDTSLSSFLAPDVFLQATPSPITSDGDARIYHLEIVQQPETSAEFGTAALSRLPLAPPLVVQLIIRDGRGNVLDSEPDLPFLISHLSLYTADGATALDTSSRPGTHFPPDRLLYGNLVSSPHHLRNLQGRAGVYFLFPDVSIRVQGRYSLRVTLMRLSGIDPSGMMRVGESGTVLAQAHTRSFDVRARQNYVAPPQTPLTEFFLQQGARMYAFASRSARLYDHPF